MTKRSKKDEAAILGQRLDGHSVYYITTSKAGDHPNTYEKSTVRRVDDEYRDWLNLFTITEERPLSDWVDLFQSLIDLYDDQDMTLSIPVPPDSPIGQDIRKMLGVAETSRRFKSIARKIREARKGNPELDAEIADLLREKSGQGEDLQAT